MIDVDGLRPSEADSLLRIREIRVRNNDSWMNILAIALASSPDLTKAIIRDIIINDTKVIERMKRLIDE